MLEEEQRNERDFELIEGHRKQTKTTIAALGKVESMKDIGHIAANIAAVVRAYFDINNGATPIIYQLASKIIETINQKNLEHVFGRMMVFALNTLNVQILEGGDDGSNLKSEIPRECVEHIARFFKKMEEHVADQSIPNDPPVWYNSSVVEAPASVAPAATPARPKQAEGVEPSKSPSASPAKRNRRVSSRLRR